jgi:L-amino acid N-acyltransferase YncA
MTVRELRWDDFQAITEWYWAMYDEVLEDPDLGISFFAKRPTLGEEAEWFARLFRQVQEGKSVVAVGEEAGRAVGLCVVGPKGPTLESAHIGVLGITIAKGWRGKGIGRALMVRVLADCRGKYEIVELGLFATNTRARALYESLGFRAWGVQPKGCRRGERYIDHVSMQLELGAAPPG